MVTNQFLRTRLHSGADGIRTKVLLAEPCPLKHGKTCPAILAACREHWQRLRDMGHFGCAVEHYCWDRFGITALEQQTRQWHAMQPMPAPPAHIDPEVLRLSEFVCITPCALHDAHNALKWGMGASFADKELMRDIYISFESVRRSANLLSSYIHDWISGRLQSHPDRGEGWVAARIAFWLGFGVDPQTADLLSAQLQLVWDGRLRYVTGAFWDGDLCDAVASALLALWRFHHFSSSRWLTVGTASRTMTSALLTGIEDFVRFVKGQGASLFYLMGL